MVCVDTSVLVDLLPEAGRRRQEVARAAVRRAALPGETLATTRFNVAELFVGIALSEDAQIERDRVARLLNGVEIIEFTPAAAAAFGLVAADARRSGRTMATMDALIAATCVAHGRTLLTHNVRHFRAVSGLNVIGVV